MGKADDTKRKIHEAALQLFVEKGVDGTTTRDLAQAAGIAEGTLYRHYVSKAALIEDLFLVNYAALARHLDGLQAEQPSFKAKLGAIVRAICALYDETPVMFRFLMLTQHQALPLVDSNSNDNPVQVLERMIAEAIARGELPPQPHDLATAMMLGLILQPAVALVYGRLEAPFGRHAETITAACWRTLNP